MCLGGLEPPTFQFTAERADQLRHRDTCSINLRVFGLNIQAPPTDVYYSLLKAGGQ